MSLHLDPRTHTNGDLVAEIESIEGALSDINDKLRGAERRSHIALMGEYARAGLMREHRLLHLYREFYRRFRDVAEGE